MGAVRPVMRLNSVVLPAPLGPMRPNSSPCATANETALTATTPPNWHVTPSTTSKLAADVAAPSRAAAGATLMRRTLRAGGRDGGEGRA